jgi:hypothetical protein
MTEQTQTPETGASGAGPLKGSTSGVPAGDQINADGQTVPGQGTGAPEPQNGPEGQKGNREARYRVERNEAREALSAAQARIDQLLTREAERVASSHLAEPADLFTLTGKSVKDFVGEDGELDVELITETANEILSSRPGLRPNQRAVDLSQGIGNGPVKPQISWGDLLKS